MRHAGYRGNVLLFPKIRMHSQAGSAYKGDELFCNTTRKSKFICSISFGLIYCISEIKEQFEHLQIEKQKKKKSAPLRIHENRSKTMIRSRADAVGNAVHIYPERKRETSSPLLIIIEEKGFRLCKWKVT